VELLAVDPAVAPVFFRPPKLPYVWSEFVCNFYSDRGLNLPDFLSVPVINQFGLRPATVKGTKQIAPLTVNKELDGLGLLEGVSTFNFHPHLPHYALTTEETKLIHVLTTQPIDLDRPHPFTAAGNTEFNSFIWMPPNGDRAGDILLADSTIFTTLFGGVESLETFWKNVATMPLTSKARASRTVVTA
jgi:hypothetical protein